MALRAFCVAAALVVAVSTAARAQTDAEKNACRPDVWKFCNPGIADLISHDRIIKCLKANRAQLAPACQRVLSARGV
jgi:hypothetical protein